MKTIIMEPTIHLKCKTQEEFQKLLDSGFEVIQKEKLTYVREIKK